MTEQTAIAGIYPMLYSFFRADGQFDAPAMGAQIEAALSAGAHGIAVGGLASEINKLDLNERHALLAAASYLDRKMREIRDGGRVVGLDRIAVVSSWIG